MQSKIYICFVVLYFNLVRNMEYRRDQEIRNEGLKCIGTCENCIPHTSQKRLLAFPHPPHFYAFPHLSVHVIKIATHVPGRSLHQSSLLKFSQTMLLLHWAQYLSVCPLTIHILLVDKLFMHGGGAPPYSIYYTALLCWQKKNHYSYSLISVIPELLYQQTAAMFYRHWC